MRAVIQEPDPPVCNERVAAKTFRPKGPPLTVARSAPTITRMPLNVMARPHQHGRRERWAVAVSVERPTSRSVDRDLMGLVASGAYEGYQPALKLAKL